MKKDTLNLQNYESALLNYYKLYLQKLEKIANLARKKGSGIKLKEDDIYLAKVAVESMCELLSTHQYFNFSTNLVQFLVPFLNNRDTAIREILVNCISKIFKDDKKEELSLQVSHLNFRAKDTDFIRNNFNADCTSNKQTCQN